MKILLLILALTLVSSSLAKQCEAPICPKNCEFGTKIVQPSKGKKCLECICVPNPCDINSCSVETTCKPISPEKYECLPRIKPGECPAINNNNNLQCLHSKIANCEFDDGCPYDQKCCSNGCNFLCTKPCASTAVCNCKDKGATQLEIDSNGCNVCKCLNDQTTASSSSTVYKCSLQKDAGQCKASMRKFYFDKIKRSCQEFIYTGCGGNENRFDSEEECTKSCVASSTNSNEIDVCSQALVVGTCKAVLQRFYWDSVNKTCRKFTYTGCGQNGNNFETLQKCEAKCRLAPDSKEIKKFEHDLLAIDKDVCYLRAERGPCRAIINRYHYNTATKSCVPFEYGGCLGNFNNFESKSQCEQLCKTSAVLAPEQDICLLPVSAGNCKASMQRFHYDSSTKSCKKFTYSGCGLNENNFETLTKCENRCKNVSLSSSTSSTPLSKDNINDTCRLPMVVGPCKSFKTRFYFDANSQACKNFTYSGCGSNGNNFESLAQCESKCKLQPMTKEIKKFEQICTLPVQVGSCKAQIPRFYFDASNKTCRKFHFTGCSGNENNFESQFECEQTCNSELQKPLTKDDINDVCLLKFEVGPCKGTLPRFHFDASTQQCKDFLYGGCQGNGNNFDSKQQCETMCQKKIIEVVDEDACKQSLIVGPCKAAIKRFYFDQKTFTCKQFVYGGCAGNANNFETLAKCEKKCQSQQEEPDRSVCQLKADQGPCMALKERFFFDSTNQKCLKFQYGGCSGNGNNFETQARCEAFCKQVPQPREIKKFDSFN